MLSGLKRGEMHIGGRSGSIEKKDCAAEEEIPREKKEGEGPFFLFLVLVFFFFVGQLEHCKQGILFIRRRPEGARGLGRYVGR